MCRANVCSKDHPHPAVVGRQVLAGRSTLWMFEFNTDVGSKTACRCNPPSRSCVSSLCRSRTAIQQHSLDLPFNIPILTLLVTDTQRKVKNHLNLKTDMPIPSQTYRYLPLAPILHPVIKAEEKGPFHRIFFTVDCPISSTAQNISRLSESSPGTPRTPRDERGR